MKPDELNDELDLVWVALGQMFGSRLYTQFGEEMPPVWKMRLSVCTKQELRSALDHFASNGGAYPPTLPEFWQACQHRTARPLRLDHFNRNDPKLAVLHLSRIKNFLEGRNHALSEPGKISSTNSPSQRAD